MSQEFTITRAKRILYADADGLADAWLTEGYQVRRGQRDSWLRLTTPMAQDGDVMRHILKQFMN